MDADHILQTFSQEKVDAILIGGMNFLLRHQPVLTYDIDFWVEDTPENLSRVAHALHHLGAQWGRDEASWRPVPSTPDWLHAQQVFCLTTLAGAVDIFRSVRGLEGQYAACRTRAVSAKTVSGITYLSLSDHDMLACQLALPESERRLDRVAYLTNYLKEHP